MLKIDKPTWSRLAGVIAILLLATSGATAQQGRRDMVLEGATLIDGTGASPIPDSVVVVEGSRIKAVGRKGQVRIPANANVIDLTGRTLLPGLIDVHVHSQEWHTPMFLHYGVTTMADKNIDAAWILAQRDALRDGKMAGPRMYASGSVMHGTYGFSQPFDTWNYPDVTTVAEARAYAMSMVKMGADIIAINQNITDDQLRAAVEVARKTHRPIYGHTRNIRRAAELGANFAEHTFTIADALIDPSGNAPPKDGGRAGELTTVAPETLMNPKDYPPLIAYMVEKGVFVNPTLVTQWRSATPRGQQYANDAVEMIKDPGLGFVPASVKDEWTKASKRPAPGYDNIKEFLREYSEAGGKVIVGTDAQIGTIPGLSVHQEMQMMVDTGITPMKAIEGATLWNAQFLQKQKDLGSVERGKIADFVVIEGDPLADITATQNIRMVIKAGQVVDTKYDPNWVNPIPQPYSVFEEDRPMMQVTKISPAIVHQGGPAVTLQIDGLKLPANAIVRLDNTDLPTQFVSETKLTATLDANLLQKAPGSYALYVLSPGLHGTVSMAGYVVIDTVSNSVSAIPVPYKAYASGRSRLYGPEPRMAPQDGKTVTLEVDGTKVAPNSIVRFDNADLPTRFVNEKKLTATLDSQYLHRHPGAYTLYVVNPGANGSVSEPGYFLVNLK